MEPLEDVILGLCSLLVCCEIGLAVDRAVAEFEVNVSGAQIACLNILENWRALLAVLAILWMMYRILSMLGRLLGA